MSNRFGHFSRGVFEDTPLPRKSRDWGRPPKRPRTLLIALVLTIGGVIGGIQLWSNTGSTYGRSGSGGDIVSSLPTGEVLAARAISGYGGGNQSNGDTSGLQIREGEGTPIGEGRGEDSRELGGVSEAGGSVRAASQEEQEKEALETYLQEKRSPLGDYVELLYQEEKNVNLSGLSRLVVAISGAESNFGKVPHFYNAWGIKCSGNTYCRYLSFEEGIKAVVALLRSPLYGFDGFVSEGDIWRIAPIYAESPVWPYDVAYFWRELE